jgi:calcineurin-like phosphoesterase family protein
VRRRQLPLAIAALALLVVVAVVGIGIATGRLDPTGSPGGGSTGGPVASPGGQGGSPSTSALPVPTIAVPTTNPSLPATLVGAGDIATCGTDHDEDTAKLVERIPGTVFAAGDNAYDKGTAREYASCYGPSWGAFKDRTRPVPGNHEYNSRGATPYFDYWGPAAGTRGQGWYAYDVGSWRIYALNSNCTVIGGCGETSAQGRWLAADLTAHPARCVLAYWHHPRFSSGAHGNSSFMEDAWDVLYQAGADVVISGHDHDYERFAPQDPNGKAHPDRGIREFVVGTGGGALRRFNRPAPNSEVRNAVTFGVIVLTLRPDGYDWRFVPVAGSSFSDSGSDTCH